MILFLSDGNQIRGDLIVSAVLRSDLSPIPLTLEADIRAGDETMDGQLEEGQCLTTAADERLFIVKSVKVRNREVQGDREQVVFRITALLEACLPVAYVRDRAIIKEGATLSSIYRAAGATLKGVVSDFPVPRFYCPVGETPSFHVARILQEEGGAVRWKGGKLHFMTLKDMAAQEPVIVLPTSGTERTESGFLERHQAPWFFSLNDSGGFVFGNRSKPRSVRYSPFKTEGRLRNMTRCLIQRRTAKTKYDQTLCAGDLVAFDDGSRMIVVTVAHVFKTGSDSGGGMDAYSRLWLGEVEE